MKLIKLDAIDSTNDFLKALASKQAVDNFTVVTAEKQTKGKGQMGAKWHSEDGKNLIVSILIKEVLQDHTQIFALNIVVALSICEALKSFLIPKISIKWPNDIMADDKKIAGILIENSIKSDGTIVSVVGFGLNVNQTNFEGLPQASSLKQIMHSDFDKEELLHKIMESIEHKIDHLKNNKQQDLWQEYKAQLFRKDVLTVFQNPAQQKFMGIIKDVSPSGKLQVQVEDDAILEFGIKEIQMVY